MISFSVEQLIRGDEHPHQTDRTLVLAGFQLLVGPLTGPARRRIQTQTRFPSG